MEMDNPLPKSWSIHTRPEIISKYQILERVGSGAYSDVYKACRLSDSLIVALKEVHDYQSAFREIEALQILQNSPNIIVLHEYFWREDEDAVLVLEFLRTDLATVIRDAKKDRQDGEGRGLSVGELKRWIIQILSGVDACHRNLIVHRDLKPSNLLISDDGVLKLADFGQARILMDVGFMEENENPQLYQGDAPNGENYLQPPEAPIPTDNPLPQGYGTQDQGAVTKEECFKVLDDLKTRSSIDGTDKEINFYDGDASCLATCTTSDIEDDPFKGSFTYEAEAGDSSNTALTSCVGTRWFRAPELLYGSTQYGLEIDIWSLGCVFAELFALEPLFPGTSDIDQLGRIMDVLGNLNEDVWPGCSRLPDYKMISFSKVENPVGIEARMPSRTPDEITLVKKLICYDPAKRATAMELLQDKYFSEEPLPVPIGELQVPLTRSGHDEDDPAEWYDYNGMGSDSDDEEFGPMKFTSTSSGFSIQFH